MEVVRFGRSVRALRRRRGWRQVDLAAVAGVSRGCVARIEQGHADRLTVRVLDRVLAPLGARFVARLDWNGEALDRLLDSAHASIVEQVVVLLRATGWVVATEVSFNVAGERGSIDVLAWHPIARSLLVVEVKSVVPDLQMTLSTLDRKARLGPRLAAERGWEADTASRLLVLPDDRTARRRIEQHSATFDVALPERGWAVRRWLRSARPGRPVAGLLFLSGESEAVARHRVRRRRPEDGA